MLKFKTETCSVAHCLPNLLCFTSVQHIPLLLIRDSLYFSDIRRTCFVMVYYPSFCLHVYFGPFHANGSILLDPYSQSGRLYQRDCNDDDDVWFVVVDDFAFFCGSIKTNPFMHIFLYDVRYFLLIKKEIKKKLIKCSSDENQLLPH